MRLNGVLKFNFDNKYYFLKKIEQKDVNNNYISGLKKAKLLLKNNDNIDMSLQRNYINNVNNSKNILILGLFYGSKLIATSGIQDLNKDKVYIGILIFDEKYLGVGLGKALVWASTYTINIRYQKLIFKAVMKEVNLPSYKSFIACGYNKYKHNEGEIGLILNIDHFIVPENISNVVFKDEYSN